MQEQMSLSRLIAEHVSSLGFEMLSRQTVERVKLSILDYFSSAIAGWRLNGLFNNATLKVIGDMAGKPESKVLFSELCLPAANAAFLNAAFGHGADIDDGHRRAMGHPGVSVIPAVLALCQRNGRGGMDAVAAITAGYDVYIRVSSAIMPSHYIRGFHGTGTVGALAAAAASARVLGLDADGTHAAISLAALQAAGILEVANSGQMSKPLNPAKAAQTGVLSALLAKEGLEAPENPLTGNQGFFHAFTDELKTEEITNRLGEHYSIHEAYLKQYPACRHTHGIIDCAAALYRQGIKPDQIKKVKLFIYPAAIKITGNILEPNSADEAKFSLAYASAVAMHNGNYTLNDLWDAPGMSDSVRRLIRCTEIVSEPSLENREANLRGARIEVELMNGSILMEKVDLPHGEPESPLTLQELRGKLDACATGMYDKNTQERIFNAVMDFENLQHVNTLMSIFQ